MLLGALGPAREDICALDFLKVYTVSGCWAKTKMLAKELQNGNPCTDG